MKEDNIGKEIVHIDDFKMFDVDQEWSVFLTKTKEESTTSSPAITSMPPEGNLRKLPLRILSIAAGLASLIGCFFFLNSEKPQNPQEDIVQTPIEEPVIQEEITPDIKEQPVKEEVIVNVAPKNVFQKFDINEKVILSDGSSLIMLAKSSIRYPASFDGLPKRYVELESGSIEFDIVSNKNIPFQVLTNNSGIDITGTVFTMKKAGIETVVKTISGSVELYSLEDKSITTVINAGEEFIFNGKEIVEIIPQMPKEEPIEEEPVQELTIKDTTLGQNIVEEESIQNEEIAMSTYNLENIKKLASKHFEDNLKFKRKSIDNSLLSEKIQIPKSAINTGDISTVDVIFKALTEQFNVEYTTMEGCESCYEISSIKPKE